jgi:hypothetical protein
VSLLLWCGLQAYRDKEADFAARQAEYAQVTAERDEVRRSSSNQSRLEMAASCILAAGARAEALVAGLGFCGQGGLTGVFKWHHHNKNCSCTPRCCCAAFLRTPAPGACALWRSAVKSQLDGFMAGSQLQLTSMLLPLCTAPSATLCRRLVRAVMTCASRAWMASCPA